MVTTPHRMLTIPGKDNFKRKRDHPDDKRAKNYRTGGRETYRDDRPAEFCPNTEFVPPETAAQNSSLDNLDKLNKGIEKK